MAGDIFNECYAYLENLADLTVAQKKSLSKTVAVAYRKGDDLEALADKMARDLKFRAMQMRRAVRLNVEKVGSLIEGIRSNPEGTYILKTEAGLYGVNWVKPFSGAGYNVIAKARAMYNTRFQNVIRRKISRQTMRRFTRDPEFVAQVGELWFDPNSKAVKDIDGETVIRNGVELTIEPEAREFSNTITEIRKGLIIDLQKAGVDIKFVNAYGVHQQHNPTLILEGGIQGSSKFVKGSKKHLRVGVRNRDQAFEEYFANLYPLIDKEKTFPPDIDHKVFMRAAFDNRVDGEIPSSSQLIKSHSSGSGVGGRFGLERKIFYKSFAAQSKANSMYGVEGIATNVYGDIKRKIDILAIADTYGTDPEGAWLAMMNYGKRKKLIPRQDFKKADRALVSMRHALDALTGADAAPENLNFARLTADGKALTNAAVLGRTVFTSLTDFASVMTNAFNNGMPFFDSVIGTFVEYMPNKLKGTSLERMQYAEDLFVGFDSLLAAQHTYALGSGVTEIGSSIPTKAANTVFEFGGTGIHTRNGQVVAPMLLSKNLGKQLNQGWDKAHPALKVSLNRFFIGENEFNYIRKHGMIQVDNLHLASPDKLRSVGAVDLAEKLMMYFVDEGRLGTPTVSAKEGGILKAGTRPGTLAGETRRVLSHLKSYIALQTTVSMGRYYHGRLGALSFYVASTTLMAAIGIIAKEAVVGRYYDWDAMDTKARSNFWVRALIHGGGLGFAGDFFLTDFTRRGTSTLTQLSSPLVSTADDILRTLWLAGKTLTGEDAEAFRLSFAQLGIKNIPGGNLWQFQYLLNRFLYDGIMEYASPGYTEDRDRRKTDQFRRKFGE